MPDRRPPYSLPELLSPAGDEESLRAAVAGGADAVYFGLPDFNARRRAANFTLERMPELIRWLHHRNVRAYLAMNTLIFSDELERAEECVAAVAQAGADAVIVQDLGLMRLIHAMCPSLPIHASTQCTQTHPDGIAFLKTLGVSRVILARELSLSQIETIAAAVDVELEVFVHGAICISFSGQCLASKVLFGRSANRGLCAQACRLPYDLVLDGHPQGDADRPYPLSPRDLCAADLLDRLVALGVAGLKIEGRLKGPAYVASATSIYRELLDSALQGRPSKLTARQRMELTLSFSRGFTTGFLGDAHPRDLVDGRFPRNRGLLVGRVRRRTSRSVVVELAEQWPAGACPLSPGDGVVFDQGRPDEPEQGGRIYQVDFRAGRPPQVELAFGRDDLDLDRVAVDSRVWKTDDPGLRRRLERSARRLDKARGSPLHACVEAGPGRRLRLCFRDSGGREVAVESAEPLAQATRHPLTVELLREQLGRLGDTPFELAGVDLIGPEGAAGSVPVMAPKSMLNDLRRGAVQTLLDARDAAARHAVTGPDALGRMRRELSSANRRLNSRPEWSLLVRTREQLHAALDWLKTSGPRPSLIYMEGALAGAAEIRAVHESGLLAGLVTTQVTMPGEEHLLDSIVAASPDVVLARSLAAITCLRTRAADVVLVGDYSLNVTNEITAGLLAEGHLARITPGFDLDLAQVAAMRSRAPGVDLELIVHVHVPMFHTAHRIVSGGSGEAGLRDNAGRCHPFMIDPAGRVTIFNADRQSVLDRWPEVLKTSPAYVRVELLPESAEDTWALLDQLRDLCSID